MPWRCSSAMMRRSVQYGLCFALPALAVFAGLAGLVDETGAAVEVAAGAVATTGEEAAAAGGRLTDVGAGGAGATSLRCVAGAALVVACGLERCSVPAGIDRLREPPAW